ncbi:hypothetical protein GO730_06030 [Spirosoma sp. HMF3257]|uniref:hypothetical protein n=1 Tax=Spirosoma telluris TaxID=2183553 RepID=UPI0012FC29F5|nr:hypothetical protein [Spirosoma telluris]
MPTGTVGSETGSFSTDQDGRHYTMTEYILSNFTDFPAVFMAWRIKGCSITSL